MKLIVGLGNPGAKYEPTRHNVGQRIIDSLVGEEVIARLYKPRAFYNLVGPEIAEQLRFHKLTPDDLLIIHDELDLPFGQMKLIEGRGAAGNHGVESVIKELGTNAFWRLRIGTGPRDKLGSQFVLEAFNQDEEKILKKEVLPTAKEIIKNWLKK